MVHTGPHWHQGRHGSASDLGVLGKCVAWRIIDFVLAFGLTLQQAKTIAVIQGGNESTLDRTFAQVSLHAHVTRNARRALTAPN